MHALKDIYLIRHGETEYNRMGVVQGSGIDADLNELGNRQAKAFFDHYQHLELDKITRLPYVEHINRLKASSKKASHGNSMMV